MTHSKIGFHVGPTGNQNGLGDWMRRINDAGLPFGLKSTDAYGPLYEAVEVGRERNVKNWLCFRMTGGGNSGVTRDTPRYEAAPSEDAPKLCRQVIENLPPEFDKSVWLEIINEPRAKVQGEDKMYQDMNACDYLGEWCLAAAKFLNAQGYKFTGPSFNSNEPGFTLEDAVQQYSKPGMLKYLRYCAENSAMAALAVHEYCWSFSPLKTYPERWGRFEAAIAAADLHGIPRTFPIFVTEFGFHATDAPQGPAAYRHLDARNKMLARWPQVKFDAAWTLLEWQGSGIDHKVNSWMGYDATKQFDEGAQPAKTHSRFGGTLPGQQTVAESAAVAESSEAAGPNNTRYVATRVALNLRSGPSTEHEVITALPRGTAVTLLKAGPWAKVRANGHVGYVASNYLSAKKPAAIHSTATQTGTLQTGMNINPDAQHANPVDSDEFKGLNWVRFPFKLTARLNPAERNDINKAFAQYDPIVRKYAEKGVKTLFVLNQETVGNNGPWEQTDNGVVTQPYSDVTSDWETYAEGFAKTAARIVAHYRALDLGNHVAYEIWNEGDIEGDSSIYLKPEHMALILGKAASTMRQAAPDTVIVFGGLASGAERAVEYVHQCRQALGGSLPVDAVGIHPYGRYVTEPPFDGFGFGTLADSLRHYRQRLPGMPLWITEIGIAADSELGPQYYQAIANYMREIYKHVGQNHASQVPVLVWFGWSDEMRNAGIVDRNGQPKSPIYKVFQDVRRGDIF